MEASELQILTAPQLVTKMWWSRLDLIQKILLTTFMVLYVLSCIFGSITVSVDDIYQIAIILDSFEKRNVKIKSPYYLSLYIFKGFWKTEVHRNFPLNVSLLGLSSRELDTNLASGVHLWITCQTMSYRGAPCESAGVFITFLGLGIIFYHCSLFMIFRVLTILNVCLGAVLIIIGYGLMFASAQEYLYCLTLLNRATEERDGFFSGRRWNAELTFSAVNMALMSITIFCLLLPLIIIGVYLLIFRQQNL